MSYLFPQGSELETGVLQVGENIIVGNGIISIPQSVSTTANVAFDNITAANNIVAAGNIESINNITALGNVSATAVYDNQNRVITSITPATGFGVALSNVVTSGPNAAFTITNTGVTTLTAGAGITLSSASGNVTVSATGADFLNTTGVTSNYTATNTDEYIGVNSNNLVTVTLPPGITGRQFIVKEERGAGTGKVNVQGTALETIDGSPFKQLTANASLTVVFRAGQWRII